MLWIALDFPCLPLETFALASAHTEPWAIADEACVLVCNQPARARYPLPNFLWRR